MRSTQIASYTIETVEVYDLFMCLLSSSYARLHYFFFLPSNHSPIWLGIYAQRSGAQEQTTSTTSHQVSLPSSIMLRLWSNDDSPHSWLRKQGICCTETELSVNYRISTVQQWLGWVLFQNLQTSSRTYFSIARNLIHRPLSPESLTANPFSGSLLRAEPSVLQPPSGTMSRFQAVAGESSPSLLRNRGK